jgi:hypothetical protein
VHSAMLSQTGRALAVLLLCALAGACSSSASTSASSGSAASSSSSASGASPPMQSVVETAIRQDMGVLDRGVLTYSELGTLYTDESTEFSVSVTDIGKTPPKQTIPAQEVSKIVGRVVYPQNVPTGGYVGVHITSCHNLSCQSQSATRQAVAVIDQVAWWYFLITTETPGRSLISLTADTYDGTSTNVLKEETILVSVNVQAAKSYQPPSSAAAAGPVTNSGGPSTPVWVWVTIGVGLIGALGAIAAALIGKAGSNRSPGGPGSGSPGSGSPEEPNAV